MTVVSPLSQQWSDHSRALGHRSVIQDILEDWVEYISSNHAFTDALWSVRVSNCYQFGKKECVNLAQN